MKLFKKAVIIGTGLIGGSLGLALKKQHLVSQITGLSRHLKNARLAKKAGAIDYVGTSLAVVKDADLIILATPVNTIIDIAFKISKQIKKDCIVIDVGSTKDVIVSKIQGVIPNFIGCHPLAGSEKRGALNLQAGIFRSSACIITPSPKTEQKVLRKVILFWRKLGSRVLILSPKRHDQILAFTSHLPHAVAFSLIEAIPPKFLNLGSTGLMDSTRISASDAHLWSEVFISNRKNLLQALSSFQTKIAALKLSLEKQNKKLLVKKLLSARKKREMLG